VAAALAGDAQAVAAAPEPVVAAARRLRPGLIVWATGLGRPATVELLVSSGFDINAYGRADVPVEDRWETALHAAVRDGDLPLARRLLALGADPDLRDKRFSSTPLGWAQHLGRPALVDLLTPLTAGEAP
jgi:ankyrin repeat protein